MPAQVIHFGDFTLDRAECRLREAGSPVDLKPRYFDVLALLAANPGELITKDRFFETVWQGSTVGDEALTQAIKDLRRALGDDARRPSFIETVPKRGYRFIAPVDGVAAIEPVETRPSRGRLVIAGALGGALAGLVGGATYGLIAGLGNGAVLPILLVMTSITIAVATLGALAIALGMAAASAIARQYWWFSAVGAALGGFIVGELFQRIAAGSFKLFLGTEHADFTGGLEGAILGAAIALGAGLTGGIDAKWPRQVLGGAAGGAVAGLAVVLGGGKLMAASLASLARRFHGSQLDLGPFGRFLDAGTSWHALAGACEGMLLGGCVVGAICAAYRRAMA